MARSGNPNPTPVNHKNRDTRWKPGVSGNLNGRPPKSKCVSSLVYDLLIGDPKKTSDKWKQAPTGAMIVAMALFAKMGKGDLTAIREGLDRVEGKVNIPLTGENGGPIKAALEIVYVPAIKREPSTE